MAGHACDGLAAVEEALTWVEKNDERIWEAELYRVQGELLLPQAGATERSEARDAEKYFHKAIEIAQRQQAKPLELRAVMSLARLWQRHGKQGEADTLLCEIYGWFTEGFETRDLVEAKALLEELSSVR